VFPNVLYCQQIPQWLYFRNILTALRQIGWYRLRNSSTGETERRAIFKLLAEEMDDFKTSLNQPQQDTLGKSVERQSKPVNRWH
jgi:hypothetical protein